MQTAISAPQQPRPHGLIGDAPERFAVEQHLAFEEAANAKSASASSVRPAPTRPAMPTTSPPRNWKESGMPALRPETQGHDIQTHGTGCVMTVRIELFQVAADHEPYQIVVRDFLLLQIAGVLAVAQDDDPIGNFAHFRQPMRNVDDSDTRPFRDRQPPQKGDLFPFA